MKQLFLKILVLVITNLNVVYVIPLHAASSANQTVTMQVDAINEIALSGSTATLTINTATAGSPPTSVSSSGITYDITTNQTNKKIVGSLNTALASGLTLTATLGAPSGATSGGTVSLSTTPADLVTGISTLNETGKTLTYTFSATSAAGVVSSFSKTVTISVVDGS